MRRLAELAIQAAIQAEEEAAWQAHTAHAAAAQRRQGWHERSAGGRPRLRRPRHPRLPRPLAPPHPRAGPAWPAPAPAGPAVTGRPSIPWSATASRTPPPTPTASAAGGDAGPRRMSAWPPASASTPSTSTAPPAWPPSSQLQEAAGLRLPGPLVATGGGGWHHWFRPTGLGNRPPRGLAHVDWRGRGGCVLAPPSRHISGRSYRWLVGLDQAPLPEVPAALRARLDPDQPTPARPAGTAGAGHARPPVRPPGPGRRAGRPRPGHPRPAQPHPQPLPRSRSTATSPAASSTTRT